MRYVRPTKPLSHEGFIYLFFVLIVFLSLSSCTKVVYTHQQVLQNCHTKDDVIKEFGQPDKKNVGEVIEEWVYIRDAVSPADKNKQDITKAPKSAIHADSLKTTQEYNKYVKFIFDTSGIVVGYKSNGVDLTKRKKEGLGISILKVLGVAVIIIVVVGVSIASDSDIQF